MVQKSDSPEPLEREIQHLVADDQLHEALQRLQEKAPAELQNEVTLLQRRLKTIEEDDRQGTVPRSELNAARQKLAADILATVRQLCPPPERDAPLRSLSAREAKARSRFLQDLRTHVENLRNESIHNARFIDLGTADTPVAAHLPWIYKNTDTQKEFGSIAEAFDAYERRLLILGHPGAGKSVTLQELALALIAEAEADPAAPIPLIVNLSKYQPSAPSRSFFGPRLPGSKPQPAACSDRSFEAWLASEFAENPEVRRSDAQRWVEEGRVAALLDGLDEVNDERRAAMAVLLNDTYFRHHPSATVVVCSRIDEYRPLQDSDSARLQLRGAITLQPLSPAQIGAYLDAADAAGLREALGRDATLEELAQVPLTLSMMTLAYGGLAAGDIPTHASVADQRHHLMESFVSRMWQRMERRARRIPFDNDRRKDIKPADCQYHPEKANRYLSWLAIRLSVRMQTACSLRKFHSFLEQGQTGPPRTLDAWMATLAEGVLLMLCVMAATLGFAPSVGEAFYPALGLLLGFFAARLVMPAVKAWLDQTKWDKEVVMLAVWIPPAALAFAAVSHSIAVVVPWEVAAMPAGLIALTAALASLMLAGGVSGSSNRDILWIPAGTGAGLALGAAFAALRLSSLPPDQILCISMVIGQVTAFLILTARDESVRHALWPATPIALAVVGGIVALQAGGLWLVSSLPWALAQAIVGVALMLILLLAARPTSSMAAVTLVSALGSLFFGKEGAVLACAAFGFQPLVWLMVTGSSDAQHSKLHHRLTQMSALLREESQAWAEHWVLSPSSLLMASGLRRLPWGIRSLLRHGGEALVLKPFSGGIEFAHRRLRDHFALRELIPRLRDAQPQQRARIIHALGFQGAAAIDLLAELIAEGSTEEKIVAVRAIARISAPEVTQHLTRALADPSPEVRTAVVGSLRNLSNEDRFRLLKSASGDREPEVLMAVAGAVIDADHSYDGVLIIRDLLTKDLPALEVLRPISAKADDNAAKDIGNYLPDKCGSAVLELLQDSQPRTRAISCMWMGQNRSLASIPSLLTALETDTEPPVRRAAAQALGSLREQGAVKPLIQMLTDRHSALRITVIEALGILADAQATEPLIGALTDKDSGVRCAAAQSLSTLRDMRAVEPLIRALASRDLNLRRAAAGALGNSGDARAVEPLIRASTNRGSDVRCAVARALGMLGDTRAVDPLIRMLTDRDLDVRAAVARALGALGAPQAVAPLIWALEDMNSGVQHAVAAALGALRDTRAIKPLRVAGLDRNFTVRRAVADALGALRDVRAVEPLTRTLADTDLKLLRAVAGALGTLEDARTVEPLMDALAPGAFPVGCVVAEALGTLGDARAVEPLIEALADTDSEVGRAAAAAFGLSLGTPAGKALIKRLEERNAHIRRAAAGALGTLGDTRAVDPLILALAETNAAIRSAAAKALGTLGDARAVEPLIRTLTDTESEVRSATAEALGTLGDGRAVEPLIKALDKWDSDVRCAVAGALSKLGDARAIQPLIQMLKDWNPEVRRVVAGALGSWRDAPVVDLLIEALAGWNPRLQCSAAELLGTLGDERAVEPLIHRLADWDWDWDWNSDVRRSAAFALGGLGDTRAVEPLIRTLADSEASVRQSALGGLACFRDSVDQRLLTRDLNDNSWLDPQEPISDAGVEEAATKLGLPPGEVRTRYETMARELGLKLGWKPKGWKVE